MYVCMYLRGCFSLCLSRPHGSERGSAAGRLGSLPSFDVLCVCVPLSHLAVFELERQQELEALALQRLQAAEITKRRQTLESLMDNRALVLDTIAEEHHRRDTSSLENLDFLLAKAELLERELNSGAYDVQQKVRMAEALSAIAEDSSGDPTVVRAAKGEAIVVVVVVCLVMVTRPPRFRERFDFSSSCLLDFFCCDT